MDKKLIWGIIIAIIIVVAWFTYTFVGMPAITKQNLKQPVEETSESPITSDWKVYSNSNFSIQYPADYKVMTRNVFSDSKRTEDTVTFIPPSPNLQGNQLSINIISKTPDTLDSYIRGFKSSTNLQVQKSPITVDQLPGTKLVVTSSSNHIERVIFQKGTSIYDIVATQSIGGSFDESQFDKFYNSIKFASPTSDFMTYIGSNFSIKYPSSWVYFKFSCNADGLAFWPKASAPTFPSGNMCPSTLLNSAPITIITEGTPQILVSDKNYQEISKQFIITNK